MRNLITGTTWAGALVAVLLGTAACGSTDQDAAVPAPRSSAPTPTPSATATATSTPHGVAPLTGEPADSDDARTRAPIIVPLTGAHPDGLDRADTVFEEVTDPVRYITAFQSRDAGTIGPVGQNRPTDEQMSETLQPLLASTGGRTGFMTQVNDADVTDVSRPAQPSAYHASGSGVFTSTKKLYAAADHDSRSGSAQTFFQFGDASDDVATTGVKHADKLRITLPGRPDQTWTYHADRHRWRRTAGGPRVDMANIVVQHVTYKQVRINKAGATAPRAKVYGDGTAVAAGAGQFASGGWSKNGADAPTVYYDADHFPFTLVPGPTWVLLAPSGTKVHAG